MVLDDRYSHCFNLIRVVPDCSLQGVSGFPWVTYSGIEYLAEFSRRGEEKGPMHLLRSSTAIAEMIDSMSKDGKAELLVCRRPGKKYERLAVAHFKRQDENNIVLDRIAVDYGYESGAIKSAPSAFMPPTRYASALDALWIDLKNGMRFQYNNGHFETVEEKNWFKIKESDLQIYMETQKVDGFLVVRVFEYREMLDKNPKVASNIYVPLEAELPMDFAAVHLPQNKKGLDEDYKKVFDAFAKSIEYVSPKPLATHQI